MDLLIEFDKTVDDLTMDGGDVPSAAKNNIRRGQVTLIVLLAIVIVGVAGYLFYQWWLSQSTSEPIRFLECSLDPAEIGVDQNATLRMTFENVDRKTHRIIISLSADPKVYFLKPNGEPLERNDSSFIYSFVLESAQSTSTLQFLVNGKLDEMVSLAGYPIYLEISVDGKRVAKSWPDLTLTVRES